MHRDGKSKTIESNSVIKVLLAVDSADMTSVCDGYFMTGHLVNTSRDSVAIRLINTALLISDQQNGPTEILTYYHRPSSAPMIMIAKQDIMSVTKMGKRKASDMTTPQKVGATLMILGLSHLVASPFFRSDHQETLALLGVGELLTGLILGIGFERKSFVTSDLCPNVWKGGPLWTID